MQALFRAAANKRPGKGSRHHSDHGRQYYAQADQKLLQQFGMQASIRRKGDCCENAPTGSFLAALITELEHHRRFFSREQTRREITEYTTLFYNRIRKKARLDDRSPAAFNQK